MRTWEEMWASILQEGRAVFDRTELSDGEVAAGLQHKLRVAVTALQWRTEFTDTSFPVFWRHLDDRLPTGMPNVDVEHLRAQVHGDKVYRLRAEPGDRDFCIYAAVGDFSVLTRDLYIGDLWREDMAQGDDESFEIILGGPSRPGNWIPLRTGTPCWVGIRQYFFEVRAKAICLGVLPPSDRWSWLCTEPLDLSLMQARL